MCRSTPHRYAGFHEYSSEFSSTAVPSAMKKALKEHRLGQYLLHGLGVDAASLAPVLNDPPDLSFRDAAGRLIGIELIEIVSEAAIHYELGRSADPESAYANWNAGDLPAKVRHLLAIKSRKLSAVSDYDEKWVCMFTDEIMLTPEFVSAELQGVVMLAEGIDAAFVMLSYGPGQRIFSIALT